MKRDIESNPPIRDKLPHFTGKHAQKGTGSYGPFGFLNPTGRRSALSLGGGKGQDHEREKSEEGVKEGQLANEKKMKEEAKAEEVQRLYRTRDNRKGISLSNSTFFLHLHMFMRISGDCILTSCEQVATP